MFYLEWLSFYSSFTLLPKRACISRVQKDNFFWNRGLYVLELIPPRREKFVFSCVAFCDTLRLSRNIRVPYLIFSPFFVLSWGKKERSLMEVVSKSRFFKGGML